MAPQTLGLTTIQKHYVEGLIKSYHNCHFTDLSVSSSHIKSYHIVLSPGQAVRGAMFGLPGMPGPPGPSGHKGEPGVPGTGARSLDTADYSNMAVRVTDYIKCRWQDPCQQGQNSA